MFGSAALRLAIETLDDDGNYNTSITENLTAEQVGYYVERYTDGFSAEGQEAVPARDWRPRSITARSVAIHNPELDQTTFTTRFTISWIRDGRFPDTTQTDIEDWRLFIDLTKSQLEHNLDVARSRNMRPISICGYAHAYEDTFPGGPANLADLPHYEAVRYAVILVKDQIEHPDAWHAELEIFSRDDLSQKISQELDAGYFPISASSWRSNSTFNSPPGYYYDNPVDSNQRWSLITVFDQSRDGNLPADRSDFGWDYLPMEDMLADYAGPDGQWRRPVCVAPYTYMPGADPDATLGTLFEEDAELWALVCWRKHPRRYWRVTVDPALEPDAKATNNDPEVSINTYTPMKDGTFDPADPFRCFESQLVADMTTYMVNAASFAILDESGAPVCVRGYTWAPEGFPTTYPNARFRAGSVSKELTALGVMRLNQETAGTPQEFGLNAPFFSVLPLPLSPAYANLTPALQMTIRQMLRHTGGWWPSPSLVPATSYQDPKDSVLHEGDWPVTRSEVMTYWLEIPDRPTDEVPLGWEGVDSLGGQVRRYSNFNYELLYDLIGDRAGLDAEQYIKEEVLTPCGMITTRLGRTERLLQLPGEVVGTPATSSTLAFAMYLADIPPGAPSPASWPRQPFGTNLARAQSISDVGNDEFARSARSSTDVYGAAVQVGSVVRGAGGFVSSAIDLARLASGFRYWRTPGVEPRGYVGLGGGEILTFASTEDMMAAAESEGYNAGFRQLAGWSMFQVGPAMGGFAAPFVDPAPIAVVGGGNIEGGSAFLGCAPAGASFSVLFSRFDVAFNGTSYGQYMLGLNKAGLVGLGAPGGVQLPGPCSP
jgi:CubicO group peptidase (beta-lactamase class C family)